MKIAIPDLGFGRNGGHRVLSLLATEWVRGGHEVTFYVPEGTPLPYFPTEANIVWVGESGQPVPPPAYVDGPERSSSRKFHELAALRRAVQRDARDADIVFVTRSFTALFAIFTRTRGRTVFYSQVYEPSGYATAPGPRRWAHELLSVAGYLAPIVHVVNAPVYLTYPYTRARDWVAPGLDRSHFFPEETSLQKRPDGVPFRIGTVGRAEPDKGTRYVVDAFRALRDAGENVELHVAFGGLDGETLAEPGVQLVVPNGDADLGDFYRSVDVHVATPTIQFGAPHYPVMEPMACGVPVVTTGYLPADETNAWIVPPHDAPAIARAILSVRDDPRATRLKIEKGLVDVAPFSWSIVADKMIDIFVSTTSRKGNRRRKRRQKTTAPQNFTSWVAALGVRFDNER